MSIYDKALELHRKNKGKISVESKVDLNNGNDLSLAYTPGVAEPCREIEKDPEKVYEYTAKGNLVAVVSSGTAVLGLGDIGAEAALPVMEGKAVLFKKFAGIDAFPLCVGSKDVSEIVDFVKLLEPTFAGINLEDISAPECFEIEKRLKEETDMAIFHDDQHGTAIVTLAGLINALKVVNKKLEESKIVINGAGAAATAVIKLLLKAGVKNENIVVCDEHGTLYENRKENKTKAEKYLAKVTNKTNVQAKLNKAIENKDIFIGLSVGNVVNEKMIKSMNKNAIVFALANPVPEINPELAKKAGAKVVATGRSDYSNQINNVLAFPGVFRGALDVRAKEINDEMKLAAAEAISKIIKNVRADKIIADPFDKKVAEEVAISVAKTAIKTGVARVEKTENDIKKHLKKLLSKNQI
ncbi:MAG: NAD(P)-dependent malic enzyme [Bacillota bacterium]